MRSITPRQKDTHDRNNEESSSPQWPPPPTRPPDARVQAIMTSLTRASSIAAKDDESDSHSARAARRSGDRRSPLPCSSDGETKPSRKSSQTSAAIAPLAATRSPPFGAPRRPSEASLRAASISLERPYAAEERRGATGDGGGQSAPTGPASKKSEAERKDRHSATADDKSRRHRTAKRGTAPSTLAPRCNAAAAPSRVSSSRCRAAAAATRGDIPPASSARASNHAAASLHSRTSASSSSSPLRISVPATSSLPPSSASASSPADPQSPSRYDARRREEGGRRSSSRVQAEAHDRKGRGSPPGRRGATAMMRSHATRNPSTMRASC
mmetsp:Transcript_28504/g.83896  ORF Transcript_28504/g.83896 Transcript_28504/m.83896 type:complete len:327 (-) Transcript_28504:287-1267(-)